MNQQHEKSPHILNTSATLLGICFLVMTSIRANQFSESTVLDELAAVATPFFMASCLLSFLSIRSPTARGEVYERVADWIFLAGLGFLTVISLLVSFNFVV